MSLNEIHKAQVSRFISFFKGKRERLIQERDAEKDEFKMDRLSDESAIYNKSDVEDLLDSYHAQLVGCMREAIEENINLSAVFVSQLMYQAEQSNVTYEGMDVASIEEKHRVDEIASLVSSGMAPPTLAKRSGTAPLPTIQGADAAMVQKVSDLQDENRKMKDNAQARDREVSELLRERSSLSSELEKVKSNFKQLRLKMPESSTNANMVEIESALNETKGMLDAKKVELDQMKKDLNQRLGDSSQFKELKAIVRKKSDEVKKLRRALADAGVPPPSTNEGVELTADDD